MEVKLNTTENQFIAKTAKYVKTMEAVQKRIIKAKPKDRLAFVKEINNIMIAMANSINGWNSWLSNINSVEGISLKEWKDLHPAMAKLTHTWLQLDLDLTKIKIAEARELVKEYQKSKKKTKKTDKTTYVA